VCVLANPQDQPLLLRNLWVIFWAENGIIALTKITSFI